MSKKFVAFCLALCIWGKEALPAQNIPSMEVNKLPAQILTDINKNPELDQESDIRRMEVVFLISLPFTAIMSLLVLGSAYVITNPMFVNSLAMSTFPPEIIPFAIFSAVFSSSVITYADFRTVQNKRRQNTEKADANSSLELQLGLGFQKKF